MRLLLFLLLPALGFAQTGFRAEFNYLVPDTPVEGGDYRLRGLYADGDALGFPVDSVTAGKFFYDAKGRLYEIVYSNAAQPLTIEVDTVGHSFAPTLGIGLLTDRTVNIFLPFETSKIAGKLRSIVEVETRKLIDFNYSVEVDKLADLLDVDTTGLGNSYIVRYVADSAKWYVFENNIDGLTDGVRNSRRIILGDASLFNQKGIFIGNNIMQNVTDNREGDNIVIGNNLANGTGVMPANSIIIGEDQGHINQYGASTRTVSIGHGNTNGRVNGSVLIGWEAGKNSSEAIQSVYIGEYAGVNVTGGSSNIMIGSYAIPLNPTDNNSIVIGGQSSYNSGANIGKGSNTAVFGNPQINSTFLYGNLNINNYGLGNKEAADLSKTQSAYLAAFATDGTLIELDTAGLFGEASGASSFVDLNDIDTTGLQDNYAFRYNSTTGLFEAKANNIDGLDDGYTQGTNNLFVGREPFSGYTGNNNVIITQNGVDSLRSPDGYSVGMVVIGANANDKAKAGSANSVIIGNNALQNSIGSEEVIAIGGGAGQNFSSSASVFIGSKAAINLTGSPETTRSNTLIGHEAGGSMTSGIENVGLGYLVNMVNGNNQIVIGSGNIAPGQYIRNTSKGPNSAKLGNERIDSTFLYGNITFPEYGLGNKEAADLSKTSTDYVLRPASDGTILEQVNNIDGLTDGYRDRNRILQIGTDGNPVYSDSGGGANDTLAIVIGNLADSATVKNRVIAIGLTDYPSNGMLIDNSIVIGKNAGYTNGKDTVQSQPGGYLNVLIGDWAGFRGTRGSQITYIGQDAGRFGGGGSNTGVGYGALYGDNSAASLFTYNNTYQLYNFSDNAALGVFSGQKNGIGGKNTYLGAYSGAGNQSGWQSVFAGHSAGRYAFASGTTLADEVTNGVFIGTNTRPADTTSINEIAIGAFATGNGSNTATLGNNNITATYLKGTTNLSGYGLGNKEAGDLSKTGSGYFLEVATDGTLIESQVTGDVQLTDLSVLVNSAGLANLEYDNTTGVFTYTPPDLSSYLTSEVDGSTTNELQTLSFNDATRQLTLSDDGTIDLTEGIQDEMAATLVQGEGITITYDDGAGTITVAAPSGAGNTDEQTLSINSATAELSISNGNTVDLSEAIDAQVNTLFVDGTNIQSTYDDGANTLTVRTTDALTQIDAITFDNNVTDAVTGRLQYDQDKGTLKFGLANNTPIYLGTDMGWYVKNQSGSSIAKGVPVYTSGTDGASGRKLISPMIADGSINAKYFLGITAEAIANGGDGLVLSNGGIKGINLSGFSANDVLYVSPTVAGTFVNTEPSAPNLKLPVGYVVNNVSNGVLSIRTTVGTYLSETHDVQIASASNGEVLKFDGSKWVDGTDLVDDADADPTNEIQTMTATNGLSVSATGNDYEYRWGGNLSQATTVDGLDSYNILFDNLTSFTTNVVNDVRLNSESATYGTNSSLIFDDFTGASITNTGTTNQYTSSLNMLRTGELSLKQDRTYASEQLSQGLTIAAADATLKLFSNSVTNSTSTSINLSPDEVKLITPNVFATTATTGQFLQLTDGATGTVEFATALTAEVDGSVTNEIQDLSLTGNTLSLSSDATTVDLSPYLDDQTVTLTGGGITAISGTYPNFTVTSTEVDGSTTNEIQTISLAGNDLTLSDGGGTVTLPSYTSESTTASNGLTLSGSDVKLGGTLTETTTINLGGTYSFNISESGSNTLFKVFNDLIEARGVLYQHDGVVRFGDYGLGSIDPSPTQTASDYLLGLTTDGTLIEVDKTAFTQDLSLTGNTLSLSGDATTVDLSGYLDNTDAQAISLTSNTLSITGNASTVDLSGYLDDQTVSLTGAGITAISGTYPNFTITSTEVDGSVTNEIQDLSLTGNTLSLTGDATTIDLSGYLDDQTVSLTGAGITAISGTYPNFTVTSTEVDGSVSNEGALSIGTGVAGSSVFIQSNTSGSTPVTISVGDGFDIAASGSTIFLNPEAYAIQSGTSGAISWGSAPQRIHVLDFGANTSITLSFTNVAVGGIYTLRVTGNSGTDTLIWPASAKFEDGTSAGTVTLQDGGQMFTFYWDGTNYWVK